MKIVFSLLLLSFAAITQAADTGLVEALKKHPSTLAAIRSAALQSQYVFIGEDHGIADSAAFSADLFSALAADGFTTLATENGPAVASAMAALLHQKAPLRALADFDHTYPDSMAFYNWQEDASALLRIAQAAGPRFQLWGFDQELMGASKYLLEQMLQAAPQEAAAIQALQMQEQAAAGKAAGSGNPLEHFMMTAPIDALRNLRARLSGRAAELMDALLESRAIYSKGTSGAGFASNTQRAQLMKRILAAQLAAAPEQKVLIKVGASHAFKGINNLGNREIGAFLAERAEGDGRSSLHILVVPAKGQQLRFAGSGKPYAVVPIELYDAGFQPFIAAAQGQAGIQIFDVRELRARARTLSAGSAATEHTLQGFDFVVVLPEGHPAHMLP